MFPNHIRISLDRLLLASWLLLGTAFAQTHFSGQDGQVNWVSDAPLELIQAESDELQGIIRISDRSFAFSLSIRSFEGFNSPLQEEHFHENYLQSSNHPRATFTGKIIEPVDFNRPGSYEVRAKGTLSIHGVEQERILPATLTVQENGNVSIRSDFVVPLEDHDIRIPRVVYQKIAEEIRVSISSLLRPETP